MSLLSRNSPRLTRARKQQGVGDQTPALSPVVKKIPEIVIDKQQEMLQEYSYKPEPEPEPEPEQLNRSLEPESVIAEVPKVNKASFGLYDLSFFCEERIYNLLFLPGDINITKIREIEINRINLSLEVYSEYSQEATIGAFQDRIYFYKGEVLIPEEYLLISGFLRKFLKIEKVNVLYQTSEILTVDCNYCNFWLERAPEFFNPVNIPKDRPQILDEDVCLDCNLACLFRHRQQMTN